MDDALGKIFSAAAGVWAIFLVNVVAIWKVGPGLMGRFNERRRDRDAAEAADWERIRAERDNALAERDRTHIKWVECEEDKMMWQSRAITAEATLLGMGIARQQVTILQGVSEKPGGDE